MQSYERIPVIRLWHVLLVPLQGEVSDTLAERLTEEVLQQVYAEEVSGLVIDITGLWLVDSHLCSVLSQLAQAAALMGAKTFLSGMKPEVALALETMGVELHGVGATQRLDEALQALGIQLAMEPRHGTETDGWAKANSHGHARPGPSWTSQEDETA
jgi:rsbT antagonist protein RsbS